ncbi:hypothetical protein ABKA04_003876 [Annulohypoxylon sp. FPYF3050]
MRPSQALMAGGGAPLGKHGKFLGEWGHFGESTLLQVQIENCARLEIDGIQEEAYVWRSKATKTCAGRRYDLYDTCTTRRKLRDIDWRLDTTQTKGIEKVQNPFAGAAHAAIFNTWRRFSAQVLYVAPPLLFFYYAMSWATDRNHYLNSKHGRAEFADE